MPIEKFSFCDININNSSLEKECGCNTNTLLIILAQKINEIIDKQQEILTFLGLG